MHAGPLSETPPLSIADIGAIALALANQVADLHRNDVVHGHIRPSRVSLAGGEVRLDAPEGDGFSKPHDVRSIGELSLWLLSRSGLPSTGPLAEVARAAANIDPGSRPTADELVIQLEKALRQPPGEPQASRGQFPARRSAVGAAALAAVVGLAAIAAVALRPSGTREESSPPTVPTAPAPTAAPRQQLPAQVWPESVEACEEIVAPLAGDLDADGCEEQLVVTGSRIEGEGGAVEISGLTSPQHVTGDWHCLHSSTLAVLDSATGSVFVFPQWARPGRHVVAVAVTQIAGATSLVSGDADGDGCDDLRVVTGSGEELAVSVPREQDR